MLKLLLNRKLVVLLLGATGLLLTGNQCTSPTASKEDGGMDTTSQNFSWEIDTLGGLFSSVRCVEIVNDTLIYAGGEFSPFGYGTTHNDHERFNLAIWNGKKWTLEKLLFQFDDGSSYFQETPISSIKIFPNGNKVFMSRGAEIVVVKNGIKSYKNGKIPVKHMYARSENDIYFVGDEGSAAHYNGTTITKLPTGVTVDLTDIWGNDEKIWAVGDEYNTANYAFIEKSNGKNWQVIDQYDPNAKGNIEGYMAVFKLPESKLYVMTYNGLLRLHNSFPFQYEVLKKSEEFVIFPNRIRGNAENDLYISDYNTGGFMHFNGKRWKYQYITPTVGGGFAVKGNLVVGGGFTGGISSALIYRAIRH